MSQLKNLDFDSFFSDLWKHINTLLAKDFPGVDGGRAAFVHLVENKALLFAATVELLPPPQAWPKNRHQLPVELRKADTLVQRP
jgi:hypothetical protein